MATKYRLRAEIQRWYPGFGWTTEFGQGATLHENEDIDRLRRLVCFLQESSGEPPLDHIEQAIEQRGEG